MQTVSEALAALPKSRKMIGANKPSYSVSIEGLTSGADWESYGVAWHVPKSGIDLGGISAETKANGKIIVCGMVSGAVYEGEVSDVDTLLGADETVTGWATTGITTNYLGVCQVFRADGDLWLSVTQAGDADENASLRLYKSASGNGGDWTLFSTVFSHTSGGTLYMATYTSGGILVLPNGRYLIGVTEYGGWYGTDYKSSYPKVYSSDDSGETWTYRGIISNDYTAGAASTQIALMPDGTLYWGCSRDYAIATTRVIKSTDGGDTWEYAYDLYNDLSIFATTFFVENNELMFITAGYGGATKAGKMTQPDVDASFEWLADQPPNNIVGGPIIFVLIGNKKVIISNRSVLGVDMLSTDIPIKSISISRNKNMAASLELSIDNKNGAWSPDGLTHKEIFWPNKVVTIEQGYGTEKVQTFKGLIDRIEMTTFPQMLNVSCRDYLKYALDQLVTKAVEGGNSHILQYQSKTVEYIVTELAGLCGLTLLDTIYTTGITIADITFSWCSYADAFQQLAELSGSDFGCDFDGKFYFVKDYIADAPTIAYTFQEGEDIINLGYTIDDADIYQKAVCYGTKTDGTGCFAQTLYTSRNYYNVLTDKYLKIDAGTAAPTSEVCELLTDRAEMLMRSRVRICTFAAVCVPWLQVGDVIQVIESSTTISEAYRITDLSTLQDETGFTMQITCYHHSYAEA